LIFDALSNDPELMHFADGVAEEIRSTVRRRTQLNVVGRASSLQFSGSGKSATHVGAVLGASHVLDGTVRRHEGTVRISAELVECSTANTVWSERFDRLLGDAFNIQDEVATAVVRALALQVSADARGTTTSNTDAYTAYVQGRILTTYSNAERSRAAMEHLKRAVDLDPEFASAHGELAVACALNSVFVPLEEIRVQWAAAFARALEINPLDSNALAAKAYYVTLTEWDWRTAGELYTKARDIGLSSNAVLLYGAHYLAPLGRWLEARDLYKATLLTDPYNLSILFDLGQWSPRLDPQDSLLCADRILEMYPGNHDAWVLRADAYAAMGLQSDARKALDQIEVSRLEKFHRYLYVNTLVTLGERRRVDQLVSEFEREAAVSPRRSWLTWTYAVAGEHEKAISSYEAEFAASEFGVLYLRSSFASLPHTPRYEALLKKMHLDHDWLRDAGLL
jgi:serine/threonine-protein kinase